MPILPSTSVTDSPNSRAASGTVRYSADADPSVSRFSTRPTATLASSSSNAFGVASTSRRSSGSYINSPAATLCLIFLIGVPNLCAASMTTRRSCARSDGVALRSGGTSLLGRSGAEAPRGRFSGGCADTSRPSPGETTYVSALLRLREAALLGAVARTAMVAGLEPMPRNPEAPGSLIS